MALRIGIIGGGGIAETHLSILQPDPAVEIVSVADINEAAARSTAQKFGAASHTTNAGELIAQVDAVLVCVPTFLHAEMAVAALEAGKHVFCEKPLARTLEQADGILAAVQKSGTVLQVGFVRRFDEEWLAWRDAVQSEKIGRPVVWHDLSSHAGPASAWFYRDEQGGGPFLDGCIHNLDFALHTFGPAEWAFMQGRSFRPTSTAFDTGTATVHFKSGDELMLAWSWGLPAGCSGARVFELLGPGGTITWPREHGTPPHFVINRGDGEDKSSVTFAGQALQKAFEQQMEEFIRVVPQLARKRLGSKLKLCSATRNYAASQPPCAV